jgi:hypothetical protein
MEFSEYENIEIFNNTQRFSINKCENQPITLQAAIYTNNFVSPTTVSLIFKTLVMDDKLYL